METLFIQGPQKTGTSTITGILNCHPEIFILFENYVAQPAITKYGHQFLDRYPEARPLYRAEKDPGKPIQEIFAHLQRKEPDYRYKYAGTKINSLDPFMTQREKNHKVIFMLRNIKSWLIKEHVIKIYRTDLDVVTPSVEYLRYIIKLHKVENSFRLWMEDLIEHNDDIIDDLSDYLNISLKPHTNNWWKKIGNWEEQDPKSVFKLDHVHHSSRQKPSKLDTRFEVSDHPFWYRVDEIFSKYYRSEKAGEITEESQKKDLDSLESLRRYAPLPFKACYHYVKSERFGYEEKREVLYKSSGLPGAKKNNYRPTNKEVLKKIAKLKNTIVKKLTSNKKLIFPMTLYDEAILVIELLVAPVFPVYL